MIELQKKNGYDYIQMKQAPLGATSELVTFEALKTSHEQGQTPDQREHVTPFIYQNPDQFQIHYMPVTDWPELKGVRLTVDTAEDRDLIEIVFKELYVKDQLISLSDVERLIKERPELKKMNSHIQQKTLSDNAS